MPTGYASFAYDGVWSYALALDKLFKSYPAGLDTIRTNYTMRCVENYCIYKSDTPVSYGRQLTLK